MKKILLVFLCTIFLIGIVSAGSWPICIDGKAPSVPADLTATSNLALTWTASTDLPDCSGVSYYNIYINGVLIDRSTTTSYTGIALIDGSYTIEVSAVDKAKNEGVKSIITVTFPLANPAPPSSGGGSSSGGGGGGGSITTSSSGSVKTNLTTISNTSGEENNTETDTNGNFLTGSAINPIDFAKSGYGIAIIILVLVIAGAFAYSKFKKKTEKTEEENPKEIEKSEEKK